MSARRRTLLIATALVGAGWLTACGASGPPATSEGAPPTEPTVPPPSAMTTGEPDAEVERAADALFADPMAPPSAESLDVIADSDDLRFAWYLAERLRYEPSGPSAAPLVTHLAGLTGVEPPPEAEDADADHAWAFYVDVLVAWDVPLPPDYLDRKRTLHLAHDPAAAPFFDPRADLDWRLVSSTGAARDEVVPLDDPGTVPADAATTDDADGSDDIDAWLPDDEPVFGVHVAGEWRAYPLRVIRAHELVNDTVGQRRIVLSYCEVCQAAVAWYADAYRAPTSGGTAPTTEAADGLGTLRFASSGLAWRGAPLAYEGTTTSLFDLYAGRAVSGRMADADVTLQPLTTVSTTWDEWADDHPATTVIAPDGGVGRIYLDEPPPSAPSPWPVGRRDDRLDAYDAVLGVRTSDGDTVAFPVDAARRALSDTDLTWSGVEVLVEGGGLVARDRRSGRALPSHESTWAAWSQFQPDTRLWRPGS